MKLSRWLVLWMMITAVFLVGIASRNVLAQKASGNGRIEAAIPGDVHPESRARISAAKREEIANGEEKQAFDRIVRSGFASPETATGIRLHFPLMAESYLAANTWLRSKSGLDPRYQELAILVASREGNCPAQWMGHEQSGLKAGLSQAAIDVVKNKKEINGLDEKEAAIILLGREMHRAPAVSSRSFAGVAQLFGERDTLTLVSLITHYAASAMLLRTYGVQLSPGRQQPF